MELKPIRTELDYRVALKRLEEILDAKLGTSESDNLELLGLMDDSENKHYPIEARWMGV